MSKDENPTKKSYTKEFQSLRVTNMKNLDGYFEVKNYVDKWFSNSNLLRKSKEERTEVISRLLFTFVAHKLQRHLNFANNFYPCFTIMMSRV